MNKQKLLRAVALSIAFTVCAAPPALPRPAQAATQPINLATAAIYRDAYSKMNQNYTPPVTASAEQEKKIDEMLVNPAVSGKEISGFVYNANIRTSYNYLPLHIEVCREQVSSQNITWSAPALKECFAAQSKKLDHDRLFILGGTALVIAAAGLALATVRRPKKEGPMT